MSHYKSNLRDIEFNLFEVLRRQDLLGEPPYPELDEETAREHLGRAEHDGRRPAGRVLRRRRPEPAGLRPRHALGTGARVAARVLPRVHGRRVVPAVPARRAGRDPGAAVAQLGHGRADPRLQLRDLDVLQRAHHGPGAVGAGHAGAEAVRRAGHRARVGRDHGADRAGRGLRRRRRAHPGRRAARRHLAPGGRQAVHHQRRARPGREHLPPGAGPPGGPRPRHQGTVHVPGAQVPGQRGRDARRAERRGRHQRRAQDGPEGLDHLRADLRRRTASPGGRHPGRRGTRRHPADVQDHRGRPDDGRHQGHRHLVHRLPERAGLRAEPGAGRRPDPDDGQDRAAGDDHPPPRRPPHADAAEGLRRGDAGAGPVHRRPPGHAAGRGGAGPDRRGRRRA